MVETRVTQVPIQVVYNQAQPARVTQVPILVAFPFNLDDPAGLVPIAPVREIWEWKTVRTKSLSGFEQRMAVRQEPFIRLRYETPIREETDRIRLLDVMHRNIGKNVAYPMFQYSADITASASIGASSLEFDPTKTDLRGGEKAVVFNYDLAIYEVVDIQTVTGTGCTLDNDLTFEVTTDYQIAPLPVCYFQDDQSLRMSRFFGQADINMMIVPPRTLKRPNQNESLSTLDGLTLLDDEYISGDGVAEELRYDLTTIEGPSLEPKATRNFHHPQWSTRRDYLVSDKQLDYWREFGDTVVGSLKPFYLPTFRNDLPLTTNPALGATELSAKFSHAKDMLEYVTNRHVRIVTSNGAIYRKVEDVFVGLDKSITLRLDTAIGSSAGDNEISKISFVQKVRIADDRIVVRHYPTYCEVAIAVTSLVDYD